METPNQTPIVDSLLNAGRKFWLCAMLQVIFACWFTAKLLTTTEYTALALPVFFAYLGVNLAQKYITPDHK